ncbi:MAG TPA: ABC transporter permease [Gemmatimonadales bacterium]|nr:ABC transporter permease [Gemmatimonadales bacterium]
MSIWRQFQRGLDVLLHRDSADRELSDELDHYVAEGTAAYLKQGLSPDDARRRARMDAGSWAGVRQEVRSGGWEHAVDVGLGDVRYALRRLRANPGFTIVATLTLALGIGASTAIFSAVNPILVEPLPFPRASQLASVWYLGTNGQRALESYGNYREILTRSRSFDALTVFKAWQPTLTGAAEPERLDAQLVTAGFFRVLGVAPALGMDFDSADDRLRGPAVVILSDGLWRRRFGADREIIGKLVTLDDVPYAVVGVMPAGFEDVLAPSAILWSLLQYDASIPPQSREWGHHLTMVGRLKAGTSLAQATRELDQIARAPVPEFARQDGSLMDGGLVLNPLRDDVVRTVRPALLAVVGAVFLVLVIACVNVTNLLLARGTQRQGEFAMRQAFGASRGRLLRQLLTESLLLSLAGGLLGLFVAKIGIGALLALSPADLPRAGAVAMAGWVFGFAFVVSTVIGIVVGWLPAFRASRTDPATGLQLASRRNVGGRAGIRRALVISEVALAVILLVSAGLLWRSLDHLFSRSPGFDADHVVTMQVQISHTRFRGDTAKHLFYGRALDQVRAVPGVLAAAWTSQLPLSGDNEDYGADLDPGAGAQPRKVDVYRYAVSPDYFRAMGIPLRSGRLIDETDMRGGTSPRAVVISESFARQEFGGGDPVGHRLRTGGLPSRDADIIVGVVGDVKQTSLALEPPDAMYTATDNWLWADDPLWLVVKTRGDAASLAPAIRRAIWSVDKDQPVVRVATLASVVTASQAQRRFTLTVFEAFALSALALAAIGLYGVLAGAVAERTREMGVRAALGATRSELVGMILSEGGRLVLGGVVLGLIGAALLSRVLASLLFDTPRVDPATYLVVTALLLAVAVVACWVPALRASRVDPIEALRAE